jgi:hypothetical protein
MVGNSQLRQSRLFPQTMYRPANNSSYIRARLGFFSHGVLDMHKLVYIIYMLVRFVERGSFTEVGRVTLL